MGLGFCTRQPALAKWPYSGRPLVVSPTPMDHLETVFRGLEAPTANNTTMESLLLLSFDNVSSKDPSKIRKGLRQIEGLLAQICLAKAAAQSPSKRQTATAAPVVNQDGAGRKLSSLSEDLAFREFFKLQDNFEWNGMDVWL